MWQNVGERYDLTYPNKMAAVTQNPSRGTGSLQNRMPEERASTDQHLWLNSRKHCPSPVAGTTLTALLHEVWTQHLSKVPCLLGDGD